MIGLFLAGWGAARLAAVVLPEAGVAGQLVAVTLAVWNPYVAERLLQGHWSLLVGYGCLPWVATAMLSLADVGRFAGWAGACALVFWIALAGLTPTGLMLAATVAVACVFAPGAGRPRWWCCAVGLGAAVLVALPWLVAAAVARFVVVDTGRRCARVRRARRTRPRHAGQPRQPRRHLERATRYPPRVQHFSRSSRRWCCSAWSRWGCRRWCADPSRCRC